MKLPEVCIRTDWCRRERWPVRSLLSIWLRPFCHWNPTPATGMCPCGWQRRGTVWRAEQKAAAAAARPVRTSATNAGASARLGVSPAHNADPAKRKNCKFIHLFISDFPEIYNLNLNWIRFEIMSWFKLRKWFRRIFIFPCFL